MKTYSLGEVAAGLCGDSMKDPERWLTRQITSGRITARKVGRQWRMTDEDIANALTVLANRAEPRIVERIGQPSAGSMRRRLAVAQ